MTTTTDNDTAARSYWAWADLYSGLAHVPQLLPHDLEAVCAALDRHPWTLLQHADALRSLRHDADREGNSTSGRGSLQARARVLADAGCPDVLIPHRARPSQ